ncbi:hypothetical protein BH11PLA1_BH11PLA1_03350 [soil metagenome]
MSKSTLTTGIFKNSDDASRAVQALMANGISQNDINIVASDRTKLDAFGFAKHTHAADGAAIGGGLGGAVGALILGFTAVGALATGGIGLLAAGPIVAALAGAGAGAAAGGLLGGLVGLGIPETEVKFYEDALNQGSIIVGVKSESDKADFVRDTFKKFNSVNSTNAISAGAGSGGFNPAGWMSSSGKGDVKLTTGKPLEKLFLEQLRDMYYAEQQIVNALPDMVKAATDPELKKAFEMHLGETRMHVTRIEQAFAALGLKPTTEKCHAIKGIIAEAKDLMGLTDTTALRDAALICAAQKVEHYEIGTYGCLRAYARTLGFNQVESLLTQNFDQEVVADKKLTSIAERAVNLAAAAGPAPAGANSGAAGFTEAKPGIHAQQVI